MNWQSAVERTVTGLGYELVDVERTAGGLLRVYIDKGSRAGPAADSQAAAVAEPVSIAEAPAPEPEFITVDDCERVTRQLQHVLEVEACAYERLEVSSPGLDRPLRKPADYARFAGEQVALTLKLPFQGRKRFQGELQAVEGGWQLVYPDGKAQAALGFTLDEVKEARLVPVLDFKGRRFAKPGDAVSPQAQPRGRGSNIEVDGGRIQ